MSDMSEQLAREIRAALGSHDDRERPVVHLVRGVVAALAAANARAEKAEQDLAWYGQHFDWCQLTQTQPCTCGLDALLAPPGEGATP